LAISAGGRRLSSTDPPVPRFLAVRLSSLLMGAGGARMSLHSGDKVIGVEPA
jgi:hypothetical protein